MKNNKLKSRHNRCQMNSIKHKKSGKHVKFNGT